MQKIAALAALIVTVCASAARAQDLYDTIVRFRMRWPSGTCGISRMPLGRTR